jgi:hypothetical protein
MAGFEKEQDGFIARPHPGLLHRGEGETLAASWVKPTAGFARNGSKTEGNQSLSPLLGERVRVRASAKIIIISKLILRAYLGRSFNLNSD